MQSAMDRALGILREQAATCWNAAARRLLEKETLDEKDLAELVGPPAGPPVSVAAE